MTDYTDFKVAFIDACAGEGMTPAETLARAKAVRADLEKEAVGPVAAGAGVAAGSTLAGLGKSIFIDTPRSVLSATAPTILTIGGLLAAGVPIAAGLAGGKAIQSAGEDDSSVEEAKARELVAEYHRQADKAKRESSLRRLAGVI